MDNPQLRTNLTETITFDHFVISTKTFTQHNSLTDELRVMVIPTTWTWEMQLINQRAKNRFITSNVILALILDHILVQIKLVI